MAVRVDDEGGIVVRAVVGPQAGRTVVATAMGKRGGMELRDARAVRGGESQVETGTGRALAFSGRERLLMRLMRQRRAGNRWPDNDRTSSSPLSSRGFRTEVTTCE